MCVHAILSALLGKLGGLYVYMVEGNTDLEKNEIFFPNQLPWNLVQHEHFHAALT